MDGFLQTLNIIPFFRHCSNDEISSLRGMCRQTIIKKGQKIELKKTASLYIIAHGIFELELLGKQEFIYIYFAALIWAPVIYIPLHYVTQGYLTSFSNIIALWIFQLPVNLISIIAAYLAQFSPHTNKKHA